MENPPFSACMRESSTAWATAALPIQPRCPGLQSLFVIDVDNISSGVSAKEKEAIEFLELYFCDKEIKNLLHKAKVSHPSANWVHGWIPLQMICTFKSVKAAGIKAQDLINAIMRICPAAFELSPDGSSIRRLVSFDQRTAIEKLQAANNLGTKHSLVLEALGFVDGTTRVEVKSYFDQFGRVNNVTMSTDLSGEPLAIVEFEDASTMVRVLSTSHSHEDSPIKVQARTKTQRISNDNTSTINQLRDLPQLASVNARVEAFKPKGQAKIQASAVLGYPINRIIAFGPVDPEWMRLSRARTIRAAFEKLGSVSDVWIEEGTTLGHIRFKSSVAKEIAEMVSRQGGLEVDGEILPVVALEGERERLFHEVQREKERLNPTSKSDSVIALEASLRLKKAGAERNIRHIQRRRKRAHVMPVPKADAAGPSEAAATPEKMKGKKRMMVDEDMGGEPSRGPVTRSATKNDRKFASPSKKMKVDQIDEMFKALNNL
ncbi:hypothetical protein HDU76_007177 [Blyttiomyces sp. JEL0837]|nr:hypothetical protein HDU76_007177 [Blyttiomyces sp. JEL0837]